MKILFKRLIKYFAFNSLLIGEIEKPNNVYTINYIKKSFYNKNIYYDLYNDNCRSNINCNDINECIIYFDDFNNYNKYSALTAEHIFPQCYTKEYKNASLDMHNIYLTCAESNSHRNNYKFIDENIYNKYYKNEKLIKLNNNNFKNNKHKFYIPCNNIRGAIARSIAYMKYSYPQLNIENVIDIELILKWNLLYPPTQIEINRNEIIKSIQGNDNPYISKYNKIKHITKNIVYIVNISFY